MQKIIIDACIAVKWFNSTNEKYTEEALEIFQKASYQKIEIIVPDIFFYEIGNIFIKSKKTNLSNIKKSFEILSRINLKTIFLDNELIIKISQTAQKYNLTFYDASYLTLATHLNIDFITDDKEIIKTKVKNVKSIQNFKL